MNDKQKPSIRFKGFTEAWEQRKLGEVVSVYDGVHQTPDYKESGIMFLSVEDITSLRSEKYISEEAFKKDYKVYPQKGDILMTRIGDVGTTNVVETTEKLGFYVSLALLKPNGINSYFLSNAIQSPLFQKGLKDRTLVTAIPQKINKDEIGKVDLILPKSVVEQKRIGEYFRNLDNLITLHQRKYDKLVNVKKSMLEKMFPRDGKNVPEIRFSGFTEAWEQRKVTEIGKIYIGLVTTMTKFYTEDGTLLIRNSDIKDGRFEFGANPIYLEESFAQKNESRMHQLGDVITVHTGDVGTSAVITENEIKSIGFATIVTRPNKEIIDSNYLCSFLNTDKHKKWAIGVSTGDGRTNYNLGDYYELIVPVPSIKEQQKIATFIQKLNHLITLHQREVEKLQNIKKSCLEKMFV